jgi:hypothetical protein
MHASRSRSVFLPLCGLLWLALTLLAGAPACAQPGPAISPPVALTGPWAFATGDDPARAAPGFDDSHWTQVDLSPPAAGAHDGDVGLKGFVPGWQARSYKGYQGYAWYRLRVPAAALPRGPLFLAGPFYVDSAYQLFANGKLIGGAGDFRTRPPRAFNPHPPRLYALPPGARGQAPLVLAVRTWMGPWGLSDPQAGGLHIAPVLGSEAGARAVYREQWREIFWGYVVDAAEGVIFLLMAALCLVLPRGDRPAAFAMGAALVLIGLRRANQAVFFWWEFETIQAFGVTTGILLIPLSLGAWTFAWRRWFGLRDGAWLAIVLAAAASIYVVASWLASRTLSPIALTGGAKALLGDVISNVRLVFLALTAATLVQALLGRGRRDPLAILALAAMSVGLFADELSRLHVPGIWFPFGVGVSRTEYAYAVFDAAMLIALAGRLIGRERARPAAAALRPA